jgi:hypothetical protein
MKRLILNSMFSLMIMLGGFSLAAPASAASAATASACEWKLQCDGGTCCTVCQTDGEIGDCEEV